MNKQLLTIKNSLRVAVPALILSFAAPTIYAADVFGPPSTVDYQGRLLDAQGAELAPTEPANFKVQFRLYDALSGGAVVWAEEQIVTVSKGLFSVRLGEGTAIPTGVGGASEGSVDHDAVGLPGAFNGKERYLGVKVIIPNTQTGEISPRLSFLTSPFSFVAGRAQTADRVLQTSSSEPSALNVASVSYVPLVLASSAQLTGNNSSILANATSAAVDATLPVLAEKKEITVTKNDASANPVTVVPPVGGFINGSATPISLAKRGDSVTLRNTDANNWVVVSRYSSDQVSADTPMLGGLLARSGAPGINGVNKNGYAFSGDNDSGLFGTADGKLSLFSNGLEKVTLDGNEFNSSANFTANSFASFFGTTNFTGLTTLNGDTRLMDQQLKLRNDSNHWLGYRSSFASVTMDGPVLAGSGLGILGNTVGGGEQATLMWSRSGGVGVVGINGGVSTEAILRVNGTLNKSITGYGYL